MPDLANTLWIHLAETPDLKVIGDLCDHLLDLTPESEIIFTHPTDGLADSSELAAIGRIVDMPGPRGVHVERFLKEHKPGAVAWLDGAIHDAMFAALHRQGIPLHLIDTGSLLKSARGSKMLSRLYRSPLRDATSITVGDPETMRMLRRERVPAQNVYFRGLLERGSEALECDDQELDALAEILRERQVWLAADVNMIEVTAILACHKLAMRRAHRLLLILVPSDMEQADAIIHELGENKMSHARRSMGEVPDGNTQVFLCDVPHEMGLWYRLAPVTYLGETMNSDNVNGPDPFHPAALGSAIIHGADHLHHASAFRRLRRADATREISHTSELVHALEGLLPADRAAELAHRAWIVSTSDSDMFAHISALMLSNKAEAGQAT